MVLGVPLFVNRFYAGEIRRYCERLLAVEARTAHVRLGLTYVFIVRGVGEISKGNARSELQAWCLVILMLRAVELHATSVPPAEGRLRSG